MLGLLLAGLALAAPIPTATLAPSDHTLVYYNARMALREGAPLESVKLWLLRNALEAQTEAVSPHDADFTSVAWAALGELGICQDGQPKDDDGAGLWPLALHNWVVRNMGRRPTLGRARPFDAFTVGRQQRTVAIGDVLSSQELATVRLSRGRCFGPRLALVRAGEAVNADFADRQVSARLLRNLLLEARETLQPGRVRGRAAIEARLFDIDLQLTALAARAARQATRARAVSGRQLGLSTASVAALSAEAPVTTLPPNSEAARILRACVSWPVSEWMSLSPDRRLFLYDHARKQGGDPAALTAIALGVLDRLIASGEGNQVEQWIARAGDPDDADSRAVIWGGDRGRRLLALDRSQGFRERAVIALHQGVDHLERGALPDALRAFSFALQAAPESGASFTIENLSRRWLSYVAAQFAVTPELLATLQELVPRREYAIILEDLMWRAAFRADRASFDAGLAGQLGRDALGRRLAILQPLASGDVGDFSTLVQRGLAESPGETLRLLDQLMTRLELEDADVRRSQLPTLARLRLLLRPLAAQAEERGRQTRTAADLLNRGQAIAEGVGGLPGAPTAQERARSLSPQGEVYVGSLRLAPVDALPWPFRAVDAAAPSIFAPLDLTPVEWREADEPLVFGWSIEG